MQKYILVKHYEEGVVDACTIENAEQLATELMLSIGFHVGNSSEFKVFSKLQQREKLREEVLIQKELFSKNLILSDDLINVVCERVMAAYLIDYS